MSACARIVLTTFALATVACEDAPKFHAPMTLGGVEISAEVLNNGARVYEMRCATCHGADGSGKGSGGQALAEPPRDFRAANFRYKSAEGDALPTDADLALTIREGRVENGMPSWRTLTAEDQHAVIQYIKTFSPHWQGQSQGQSQGQPQGEPQGAAQAPPGGAG